MAKLTYAAGMPGLNGRMGRIVYKRVQGRDIAARVPDHTAAPSEAQLAGRAAFAAGAAYARDVLGDPSQAKVYARLASALKRPVNSILIGDYRTPPTVDEIDDSAYHGRAGDVIRILASDDLQVVAVKVTLCDRAGAVIEQGPAIEEHGVWVYTALTTLAPDTPLTIDATALDRPRHEGKGSQRWMPTAP